jgi:hypothetical protein
LATISPNTKAIGGETKIVVQNNSNAAKMSCRNLAFTLKKIKDSF